jgi:hypothetical protein
VLPNSPPNSPKQRKPGFWYLLAVQSGVAQFNTLIASWLHVKRPPAPFSLLLVVFILRAGIRTALFQRAPTRACASNGPELSGTQGAVCDGPLASNTARNNEVSAL